MILLATGPTITAIFQDITIMVTFPDLTIMDTLLHIMSATTKDQLAHIIPQDIILLITIAQLIPMVDTLEAVVVSI